MKKSLKTVMSCLLTAAVALSVTAHADAKNYYSTKYEVQHSRQDSIVKRRNKNLASVDLDDTNNTGTVNKDFDGDKKKETVKLSRKFSSDYKKADISVYIKGKKQVKLNIGEKESASNVEFSTVKLDSTVLAVLLYGDNDYAGGGLVVYTWSKNDSIKKIMSYKAKGYLSSMVSSEKSGGKKQFYIVDSEQLVNHFGSKWPADVLKKYKKWENDENVSVTRTSFIKYTLKNNKLNKAGKDAYYHVSRCYD
ncbi:MAG: hypothetical protein SOV90_03350 [Lachnospiraceae bacterium]|nr:hypothetical protein [Lachnospiraceae bacterium]